MGLGRSVLAITLCALLSGACAPEAPPDDAGHLAWTRQVVRHLLHRNAKGSEEARLLVDLVGLVGRREVARMLMAEPEFARAQTHQLMDQLEVQRGSSPLPQPEACFAGLERLPAAGDGGALARWVRDRAMHETISDGGGLAAPGGGASGPWNFVDLAYSSILEDDLRPLFKAYMIPAVVGRSYDADKSRDGIGLFFNRVFLGRDVGCTACHNSAASVTNVGWLRTHPLPIRLEKSLWDCDFCSGEIDAINNVFRQDASGTHSGGPVLEPWGMDAECGSLALSSDGESLPTVFAGLDGDAYGVADLVEQFSGASLEPYRDFRCVPMNPTDPSAYDVIPGDEALVFGVAATFAQNVWKDLMGSPLTLPHGFARNGDQMLLHCELTERVLRSGWSLRDLLAEIVTRAEYNRRAPEASGRPAAFELPLFFDPFTPVVADPAHPSDPCAGPAPLPSTCFNGKGEQVVRYSPQHLLRRTHRMLGWPEPPLYPSAGADEALNQDLDQYLSTRYPGSDVWSFQSLLTWEDATSTCEKPTSMGSNPDWIDRLVAAVGAFDAAHPDQPLSLRDVVQTLRDWLLQDAALIIPGGGGLVDPTSTEEARIAAALGVPNLGVSAAALGGTLGDRMRDYCGVLLETPQYTLTEVPTGETLVKPRLQVCNESPCTYQELCSHYRTALAGMGHAISCGPGGATRTLGLQLTPLDPDPDPRIDDLTAQALVRRVEQSTSSELRETLERAGQRWTQSEVSTLQQILAKTPQEDVLRALPDGIVDSGGPSRELVAALDDLARRTLTLGCLDRDADGTCDSEDLCPDWPARLHADVDGNGIGDDCECGDQSGDGRVSVRDLVEINRAIFTPSLATPLCDANDDGRCTVADIVAANQKIFGKPAYCSRYPGPRG